MSETQGEMKARSSVKGTEAVQLFIHSLATPTLLFWWGQDLKEVTDDINIFSVGGETVTINTIALQVWKKQS